MSTPRLTPEQFEALLDARRAATNHRELQEQIEQSPQLVDAARLQKAIDESLHRSIRVPAADAVLLAVKSAAARPALVIRPARSLGKTIGRVLSVAACIALMLFAGYRLSESGLFDKSARDRIASGKRRLVSSFDGPSVIAAHEALMKAGYRPEHALTDSREIASSVWKRTGQGLIPTAAMPAGARVIGMSEVACLSPHTLALMMQVDGKPLTVLIDKLENDRFICVERPMEITPFRQEVGSLVLYEVTPHGRPIVRECFSDPQQSREWYEGGGGF